MCIFDSERLKPSHPDDLKLRWKSLPGIMRLSQHIAKQQAPFIDHISSAHSRRFTLALVEAAAVVPR
jgi:hypothetical protein